jgi:hypothetical protein
MKAALGIAAVAALASMTAAPAAGERGATSTQRPPEKVYAVTCGYCHGANVGPVIRGRNLPAAYVVTMTRNGRGAMPAFRPTEITHAELASLSRWIEASPADLKEQGQ